jgi:outer membrane protein assembly factor BamB
MVRWQRPLAVKPADFSASITPLVANGISYFVQGGTVYALRASDGHRVWRWDGGNNVYGMWLKGGTVTILEDEVNPHGVTHLAGLDTATGHVRWEDDFGGSSVVGNPVATANGVLAYQAGWDTITALDLGTGRALWSAPGTGGYQGALAAYGTTVISTKDSRVVARDSSTGKPLWEATVPGVPLPAFQVSDDILLVTNGTGNGVLAALDPANGKKLWQFDRASMPALVMAASANEMVLELYQQMYTINPRTGRVLWSVGARTSSVAIGATAGVVVYALDLSATGTSVRLVERSAPTGKLLWQEALPNGSGMALVTQQDVIDISTGSPRADDPMPMSAYLLTSGRHLWSVNVPAFFLTNLVRTEDGGLLIDASDPPYGCSF